MNKQQWLGSSVAKTNGLFQATNLLAQSATNEMLSIGVNRMRVINQRRWNRTKKFMIFILVLAALGMVGGLNESMDVEISADRYGFAYLFMGCAAYLVFTIIRKPD